MESRPDPLPRGAGAGRRPVRGCAAGSSRTSASWPTSAATTPRRWPITAARSTAFERSGDDQGPRHRLSQPGHGQRRPGALGRRRALLPAEPRAGDAAVATCTSRASVSSTTPRCQWPGSGTSEARRRGAGAGDLQSARRPARQGRRLQGPRRGLPGDRPPRAGRVAAPRAHRAGGRDRLGAERGRGLAGAGPAATRPWAGTRRPCSCSAPPTGSSAGSTRGWTWSTSRPRSPLEETYLAVVRDWGQSIESADSYTFGHCERVAGYAVAVARAHGARREGSRPRSGWAPTCTTWARSGCPTRS